MSIRKKLIIAFVLFSFVLILIMAALMKWSFQSGFATFMKDQEIQRLQTVAPLLADYYRQNNGWASADPHFLDSIDERPLKDERGRSGRRHWPLFVLDENRQLIMGRGSASKERQLEPIIVNGQAVGFLGVELKTKRPSAIERRFMQRQAKQLFFIVGIALIVSVLFAWPMSSFIVQRIKQLGSHVRYLSQGDYEQRIALPGNDEISQLADHLNALSLTLQQGERARRQLVADISHELRTPLATLRAQLEAIEDGVHQYNSATHARLNNQVLRLNDLVSDLYQLSLSDIGAFQYHKDYCDLNGIITPTVQSFQNQFSAKGVTLEIDNTLPSAESVFADQQRLIQLFSNLLQNSLQYIDAPGTTRVQMYKENDYAVIVVADSAPGVPKDQQPHIFDRLYRGESSRNRAHGGAGLGLSLCQNIVIAHNGSILAGDSALGGLAITIRLPLVNS